MSKRIYADEKAIFPKTPRNLNKSYKLSEEQVKQIRKLYKTTLYTQATLAELFKVNQSTICFYTNKQFRKESRRKSREERYKYKLTDRNKYDKRKKKIMRKQMQKYQALKARARRAKIKSFKK